MPAITLDQLLESRDRRAARQRELLAARPDRCLLSLTVQIPGAVKRNALSLAIARAGVEAVRSAFSPEWEELRDLETGYEAFFLLPGDPLEIKRRACRIEDTHPLGRLLDLDVLALASACAGMGPTAEGNYFLCSSSKNQFPSANTMLTHKGAVVAVGREAVGLAPRRCLLCGNESKRAKIAWSCIMIRKARIIRYGCR